MTSSRPSASAVMTRSPRALTVLLTIFPPVRDMPRAPVAGVRVDNVYNHAVRRRVSTAVSAVSLLLFAAVVVLAWAGRNEPFGSEPLGSNGHWCCFIDSG